LASVRLMPCSMMRLLRMSDKRASAGEAEA
jgi:hypothetical protein